MPVVIGEIVTETVVGQAPSAAGEASARDEPDIEAIVRRATERVLETLRREWDR